MLPGLIIVISLMVVFSFAFLFWDKFKLIKEKKFFTKSVGKKTYHLAIDNDLEKINMYIRNGINTIYYKKYKK